MSAETVTTTPHPRRSLEEMSGGDNHGNDFGQWGNEIPTESAPQHAAPEGVTEEDEPEDNRELSPMSARITRAANRIKGYLEKRAMGKAHTAALDEYRERDPSDYVDHIAKVAESDNPQAAEYAQGQLDTENIRADRQEMLDNARNKLASFGKAALHGAKEAGVTALGVGIITAETAVKSGRYIDEKANKYFDIASGAVETGIMNAGEAIQTGTFRAGMLKNELAGKVETYGEERKFDRTARKEARAQEKIDKVDMKAAIAEDKAEARQFVTQERAEAREAKQAQKREEATKALEAKQQAERLKAETKATEATARAERLEAVRAERLERARLAKLRSEARAAQRREKYDSLKNKGKEFVMGIDTRRKIAFAAGSAAIDAYRMTTDIHKKQNSLEQ